VENFYIGKVKGTSDSVMKLYGEKREEKTLPKQCIENVPSPPIGIAFPIHLFKLYGNSYYCSR
jgi:hypothetical protein